MKKAASARSKIPFESLESRLLFASGDFDVALNNDHLATTAFHLGGSEVNDVATLADGSMIAVGQVQSKKGVLQAAVAEYNFDGSLNTSFGDQGTVVGLPGGIVDPTRVQVGYDGSIYIFDATASALTRLTAAGVVDTGFGEQGSTSFVGIEGVTGFTLDANDDILIAGTSQTFPSFTNNTSNGDLRRYTPSGHIDSAFNRDSDVIFGPLGKTQTDSQYRTLTFSTPVVDSQGNILVAANDALHANHKTGAVDVVNDYLYRFTSTGSIDRTFGTHGNTALPDGNASIAGLTGGGLILLDSNDHLTRYTPNGTLDTTYGTNGVSTLNVTIAQRAGAGHAFAVAADGSVTVIAAENSPNNFGIEHILPNGTLDTDFRHQRRRAPPRPSGQSWPMGSRLLRMERLSSAVEVGSISPSGKVDTRTFAIGRLYTSKGPAIQLVPRTLKTSSRYLSMTVEIRDNEGVKLSTLDNSDLKLFDADGDTRKIRFLNETDIRGDGRFIEATYRIVAPDNDAAWTSSPTMAFTRSRLQKQQITDENDNPTAAQILGIVRVKIA